MFYNTQGKLHIEKLFLQETGTFNQQFARPYVADVCDNNLSALSERISSATRLSPSMTISPALLSGMHSSVIRPATNVERPITIINGWNERRFRFTLEVHEDSPVGGTYVYQFYGYSEYFDLSHGGEINPNMVFFINGYNRMSRMMASNGTGLVDHLSDTCGIVNGNTLAENNAQLYGLRTEDLLVTLQSGYITGNSDVTHQHDVMDTRIGLKNKVFSTSRYNQIPSNYLSRLVDTYRSAQVMQEYGEGNHNVLERSIGTVHEASPFENRFIRDLSISRGMNFAVSDFTIQQLMHLDLEFNASKVYYQPVEDLGMLSNGCSEDWNGRDNNTLIASTLARSVPSLMISCGLVVANFTSTNQTLNGLPETNFVSPAVTIATMEPIRLQQKFLTRFNTEILPDITSGNLIPVQLFITADVKNEIHINISVEGYAPDLYIFPCFCDSLLQPTVTTDSSHLSNLIVGVESMLESISLFNTDVQSAFETGPIHI
jgi:hypothetical protein